MTTKLIRTWNKFERSFIKPPIKIKASKKPDFNRLFDTKEHLITTTSGLVHVRVHLEMVGNILMPLVVFSTSSKVLRENFLDNGGEVLIQQLSHELKAEYQRMLDA